MPHSFDIFDTLLVRGYLDPRDLFEVLVTDLVAHGILSPDDRDFAVRRAAADSLARKATGKEEISLADIYHELAGQYGWDARRAGRAAAAEEALELAAVSPIAAAVRKVRSLHARKESVAYVSDMYLGEEVVRSMLEKHGIWQEGDRLYLSSSYGVRKDTGGLYRTMLAGTGHNPQGHVHTGDNRYSDVRMARAAGLTAVHVGLSNSRYEEAVGSDRTMPSLARSLIAGSMRATHLANDEPAGRQASIWNIAADVCSPVLFGYVLWVLRGAKEAGLSRLYFVARDGHILLQIAQVINERWGYGIDCRYLYGSRQSWHLPSVLTGDLEEYEEWAFDRTQLLSPETVCGRLGIDPSVFEDDLAAFGFFRADYGADMDEDRLGRLKECLASAGPKKLIAKTAAAARDLALAYFRQEGLLDESSPYGIVDIGWNGRIQRSLNKILRQAGLKATLQGFYLSLKTFANQTETSRMRSYIDQTQDSLAAYLVRYIFLYEIFVSADHGSVLAYRREGTRIEPTLREKENTPMLSWGLRSQQGAVLAFARLVTASGRPGLLPDQAFRRTGDLVMRRFLLDPTQEEAEAYGSVRVYDDQKEKVSYELSPRLGFFRLLCLIVNPHSVHRSVWVSGSVRRSGGVLRFLYSAYVRIRLYLRYPAS